MKLCRVCHECEAHGYVQGTGEYLEFTCLKCHRRKNGKEEIAETGSSKRSQMTPVTKNMEGK